MALELLSLTPPSNVGQPISLNGSKWGLLDLDLGNPSRREELVTSMDSHGGMPARVSMRDAREVTAKLQLIDATTVDGALDSIGALERYLELAERLASNGPTNPVEECVRLVYTPADATTSYSLIVLTSEITGVPKTLSGEDAGWFIKRPVVTVRFVCDPFAYGARRTYLDTTTSAEIAPSISVPGGPGDVSPWTRMAIKDVAATGRGLLRIGVKNTARNTTATDFDGVNDSVTTTYNPMAGERTFMGWAYRDTSSSDDALLFGASGTSLNIGLSSGGNNFYFSPNNSTFTTWAGAWPGNGQWVHWAVTFNVTTDAISLYINGSLVTTTTNTGAWGSSTLQLGSGAPFDGKMAWVSVHEKALTAEEISAASKRLSADQLISFGSLGILLPLDAASGLTDLSGNSRNGTASGGVTIGAASGPLDESALSAVVPATSWTAVNGALSVTVMATSSTDYDNWTVLAQIPRQFRNGSYRVYAENAYPTTGPGGAQVRIAWRGVGSSIRRGLPAVTVQSAGSDLFLGEISTETAWDAWIETRGPVGIFGLILVPTDSYLEATGPLAAVQMVGTTAALDALQSTSADIEGRTMTTGGTWTTPGSPVWPVSAANWARRTATGMGSPAFAQAGTGNHMEVQVQASIAQNITPDRPDGGALLVAHGVYARYVDGSNYLVLGVQRATTGTYPNYSVIPRLVAVVSGTPYILWENGKTLPSPISGVDSMTLVLQLTQDGRWTVTVLDGFGRASATGFGQRGVLASGGTLGNTGAAKAGLFDHHSTGTTTNRDWKDFSISNLAGVTPSPLPSGQTVRLQGPKLTTTDGTEYPYIGSSGVTLRPGVNNNLTVMAQRVAGLHGASANTAALDIDIDGYPRFLSVPHS
jgi:hypothetical protein